VEVRIETCRCYDIKTDLQGPSVKAYLNGKLVRQVTQQQAIE
jgi:hypothetical protein